ncbi:hypothetical protein CONLIGDRAFT_147677 [Coniochaeta ligniaria NRRL 30616]|uniref:Uncharacterized protein n=1 Tax=Coniochaeta ligniaria NRRL 30616 TaxID=1408157 RepID=A0A1J7INN2_9PEZI|nr:hypothetical protein CONLIGDRAFT_147677 [Coniochaeta ligniaria NRRL 30616]
MHCEPTLHHYIFGVRVSVDFGSYGPPPLSSRHYLYAGFLSFVQHSCVAFSLAWGVRDVSRPALRKSAILRPGWCTKLWEFESLRRGWKTRRIASIFLFLCVYNKQRAPQGL